MTREGGGGLAMAAKHACNERANQASRGGEGKGWPNPGVRVGGHPALDFWLSDVQSRVRVWGGGETPPVGQMFGNVQI